MGGFGLGEWLVLIVIVLVIYFFRKGSKDIKNNKSASRNETSILNTENKIPILDTCPHCKNPNTNRLRNCEWCGNQIC